jgi:REP element-mobilizing transposase RayT
MTNHIHLIIDPGDEAGNLAQLMKRVGGRQTRYVNKTGRPHRMLMGRPLQIESDQHGRISFGMLPIY